MLPDLLTDSVGNTWHLGRPLGRGTWGRSLLIRDDVGREAVLKVPLTQKDLGPEASKPLLDAVKRAAFEQADLLDAGEQPYLPPLLGTVDLDDGSIGLVLPRYSASLARRLDSGFGITDTLKLTSRIAVALASAAGVHGNLTPSNVLFSEGGGIVLSDPETPALIALRAIRNAERRAWLPPEASGAPHPGWDTYALSMMLFLAAQQIPGGEGRPLRVDLPTEGLDKVALAELRDRALARLSNERSNPRFRARLTEKLASLLNRALSLEHSPTPPYRFETLTDLIPRLNAVVSLIRPGVTDVGKMLLPSDHKDGTYVGGEAVEFTITVGCTAGVTDHEDLIAGLALIDLDDPDGARVPMGTSQFRVNAHPSGRLRYAFSLPEVPPGRYRVRVAFAIKDSGDAPSFATGDLEVRPRPGYVPPRPSELVAPPIDLAARRQETAEEEPNMESLPGEMGDLPDPITQEAVLELDDDHQAEVIEGVFPRPIAPPSRPSPISRPAPVQRPEPVAAVASFTPSPPTGPEVGIAMQPTEERTMPAPIAFARPSEQMTAPPTPSISPPALPTDPGMMVISAGPPAAAVPTDVPVHFAPDPPAPPTPLVAPAPSLAAPMSHLDASLYAEDAYLGLADLPTEDLPTWERTQRSGFAATMDRIRQDKYASVFAAVAACLAMVLVLGLLLQAL